MKDQGLHTPRLGGNQRQNLIKVDGPRIGGVNVIGPGMGGVNIDESGDIEGNVDINGPRFIDGQVESPNSLKLNRPNVLEGRKWKRISQL